MPIFFSNSFDLEQIDKYKFERITQSYTTHIYTHKRHHSFFSTEFLVFFSHVICTEIEQKHTQHGNIPEIWVENIKYWWKMYRQTDFLFRNEKENTHTQFSLLCLFGGWLSFIHCTVWNLFDSPIFDLFFFRSFRLTGEKLKKNWWIQWRPFVFCLH